MKGSVSMENIWNGKTILVTGGTGSIGSEIVRQLLNYEPKKVIVYSRDEIKQFIMRNQIDNERLEMVMGDVRDFRSTEKVFSAYKIDYVYHAAAMKHVVVSEKGPTECVKTNIMGTENVVDLALRYGIKKMITISTDKAANPTTVMGATKFIAERITLNGNYLAEKSQAFACVRFGNVANSRGSVIPIMIDSVTRNKKLWISQPKVTRFIMKISDATELVLKSSTIAKGGEIFVLKMPAFRLGDMMEAVIQHCCQTYNLNRKDITIESKAMESGEKIDEELINGIEAKNLYELEDMYIISEKRKNVPPNLKKIILNSYNSKDTKPLSVKQLKKIIDEINKDHCRGTWT
jgi:UDP-N-acetylglucosamine 4,6-dehydratase/5-epimerase